MDMRHTPAVILVILWTSAYVACGGSTGTRSGNAALSSTVPSIASNPSATAIAGKGIDSPEEFPNQITVDVANVDNVPDICAFAGSNGTISNLSRIVFVLGSRTDPADVVSTGTLLLGDRLGAVILANDAGCNTTDAGAMAGTVDITHVGTASIAGRFDLTFPSGNVTGSFDAPMCNSPASPDPTATDAGDVCVTFPSCGPTTASERTICLR